MGAISQKRVATLLRKAQTAGTTTAQGEAFENLLCYVFEQVPGIVVSRRNQRNNSDTEEIDIAFWNDRSPKGFTFLPHIILAECKHWSKPVGSEQVAWFVQKLRHRGLEYGLMLAHKGITSDTNSLRDAYSIVSDAQRDGIRVLVITTVELRTLTSSGDLIILLKEKLCDLAVKGGTL